MVLKQGKLLVSAIFMGDGSLKGSVCGHVAWCCFPHSVRCWEERVRGAGTDERTWSERGVCLQVTHTLEGTGTGREEWEEESM